MSFFFFSIAQLQTKYAIHSLLLQGVQTDSQGITALTSRQQISYGAVNLRSSFFCLPPQDPAVVS